MKKFKSLIKLNSNGFSHHLIIPVIAIFAVAGIGAYVVSRSNAAVTPASLCGSGYYERYSYALQSSDYKTRAAKMYLMTNGTSWCGVTLSTGTAYGVSKPMSVKLGKLNADNSITSFVKDEGTFKYYAGPVRYNMKQYCANNPNSTIIIESKMTYNGIKSSQSWANGPCKYIY